MVDEERLAKAIEAAKDFPAATGREFDPETEDLYGWAMKQSESMQEGFQEMSPRRVNNMFWSAWFAARKMSMILLTFTREREGQEITPEMVEEMRQLCARIAYD